MRLNDELRKPATCLRCGVQLNETDPEPGRGTRPLCWSCAESPLPVHPAWTRNQKDKAARTR